MARIAFLNIYQGKVERGLETYVKELSERLGKKHDVDVFEGSSDEIKRWPVLWRFYLDPHGIKVALFTLKIIPKILNKKYHVVIPLNGGWQPALVRIITWLYGGKMIIPGQSGRGWDERNNIWSMPDMFVGLSKAASRWSKKVNPFVRSYPIPNGVDLKKFHPKGNTLNVVLKKPIILCVASLTNYKRIDLTINAVAKLSNCSLLVVGGGPLKKSIEKLGKQILKDRFLLTKLPYVKMPDAYRTADIFTLPSLSSEAFGNVLIEAMATNLPVVATDDLVRREIIGDAGFFVDPEDVNSYSEALKKALDTKWGNKPRERSEMFSWDIVALKYEKIISELLERK